jgi:cytochrome P450
MPTAEDSKQEAGEEQCPYVKIDKIDELIKTVRSKGVISDVDDFAGGSDPASQTVADNFLRNVVTFVNGDAHLVRRKLWNSLVRPAALEQLRETVVLPALRRHMTRMLAEPNEDGAYEVDLCQLVERTVLEMGAKLIGFSDVDTEEGLAELQECIYPMFTANVSVFYEDRDPIIQAGLEARKKFVERFLKPAIDRQRELLAKVEAGELSEGDLPMNLARFFASVADPAYEDLDLAIREANTMFITSTGTSVQAIVSTVDDLSKWFEKHPEDYHLRTDLEFISRALQESIRLKAPYISYMTRRAVDDFTVGDKEIKAGQLLHIKYPVANRSTETFGEDASEFNPWRKSPEGLPRYGVAFGSGEHQCFGLRVVLGNDGKSGSHLRIVRALFEAGVRPHASKQPDIMVMKDEDHDGNDIVTYSSYPAEFTSWDPSAAATTAPSA